MRKRLGRKVYVSNSGLFVSEVNTNPPPLYSIRLLPVTIPHHLVQPFAAFLLSAGCSAFKGTLRSRAAPTEATVYASSILDMAFGIVIGFG